MSRPTRVTSRIMAAVPSRDTRAEVALRRRLWRMGLRYRKNIPTLPGKPDIAFGPSRVAVFVDGDYWHGNAWRIRGLPSFEAQFDHRNSEWWRKKIKANMDRDREVTSALELRGWRVLRFWESEIQSDIDSVADRIREEVEARRV